MLFVTILAIQCICLHGFLTFRAIRPLAVARLRSFDDHGDRELPPLSRGPIAPVPHWDPQLAPKTNFKECHYAVLEVDPQCSDQELDYAYQAMLVKHHPDPRATLAVRDVSMMQTMVIKHAYRMLKDPETRAEYDEMRLQRAGGGAPSSRPKPKAKEVEEPSAVGKLVDVKGTAPVRFVSAEEEDEDQEIYRMGRGDGSLEDLQRCLHSLRLYREEKLDEDEDAKEMDDTDALIRDVENEIRSMRQARHAGAGRSAARNQNQGAHDNKLPGKRAKSSGDLLPELIDILDEASDTSDVEDEDSDRAWKTSRGDPLTESVVETNEEEDLFTPVDFNGKPDKQEGQNNGGWGTTWRKWVSGIE